MSIITSTGSRLQAGTWQETLRSAIRDTRSLGEALGLDLPDVTSPFELLVPAPYLARIRRGDPDDPLLRQVLISAAENVTQTGFDQNPLQESRDSALPQGVIQKYRGRILIIATGRCAINCRYCFRRHFPYQDHQPDQDHWRRIVEHIRSDPDISEVILSGGDPLVMNDRYLGRIATELADIPHVRNLRIHSRLPVVIPERVCDALLDWVRALNVPVVLVTHVNHAREIDDAVIHALSRLRAAGVTLLNQSVLLRDINDDADTLASLSRRLFEAGVLPYYLHLLDPVEGAAHFDVREARGQQLMESLAACLPGYLVPRLVREVPGADAKQMRFPMA